MKKVVLLILAVFLLGGCSQNNECGGSYIMHNSACCLDKNENLLCDDAEAVEDARLKKVDNVVYYGDANGKPLVEVLVEAERPASYYLWIKNRGDDEKCRTLLYEGDMVFEDRIAEDVYADQNYSRVLTYTPLKYFMGEKIINNREVICETKDETKKYNPEIKIISWSLVDSKENYYNNVVVLENLESKKYVEEGNMSLEIKIADIQYERCSISIDGKSPFWMKEKEQKKIDNYRLILARVSSYSECDLIILKA